MNLDYNKMLFMMFWEQNEEKSFEDFGVVYEGMDFKYSGIKFKHLQLDDCLDELCFKIGLENYAYLCFYDYTNMLFDGFFANIRYKINILDYIKFEDKV